MYPRTGDLMVFRSTNWCIQLPAPPIRLYFGESGGIETEEGEMEADEDRGGVDREQSLLVPRDAALAISTYKEPIFLALCGDDDLTEQEEVDEEADEWDE
jgi:hypothetical protein